MNRIYSLVWNRTLRIMQVASELASTATGGACTAASTHPTRLRRFVLAACVAFVVAGLSPMAFAGYDVNIVTGGTGSITGGVFSSSATDATIAPGTIETALEGGTDVSIFTGAGGSATGGDITVTDPVSLTNATSASTFSLQAVGSDFLKADVTGDGMHALNVNLWANYGGAAGGTSYVSNGSCAATSGCVVNIGTIRASTIITSGGDLDVETGTGGGALVIGGAAYAGNIDTGSTGNLTVHASGISQGQGSVVVGGTSTLDTGSGDITLANAGNDFGGAVAITGGNVQITDANALTLGNMITGSLTASSTGALNLGGGAIAGALNASSGGGAVTQSGSLTVLGITIVNAGAGSITLANFANDFGGAVAITGGNVQITDGNALTLGVLATGSLTATSTGALNLGSGTIAGFLDANSSGGAISQSGSLTVTGATNVNAGTGSVTLTNAGNDFTGAVTATGTGVSIVDKNDLAIASVTDSGNGNVSLTAGGTLTLPASDIDAGTGNLTLASNGGALVTGGNLSGANVSLSGADGITLSNNVTGAAGVALASSNGGIAQAGGIVFGTNLTGSATGSVALNGLNSVLTLSSFTANGFSFTNAQALTVYGPVDGGAGGTSLTTQGNLSINGALGNTNSNTTLTSSGAINEGANGIVKAGMLTGSSSGATTLGGANQVANLGNFTANGFTLANAQAMTVTGVVNGGAGTTSLATTSGVLGLASSGSIAGGSVALDAASGMQLDGAIAATGAATLSAGGSMLLDGTLVATGTEVQAGSLIVGGTAGSSAQVSGDMTVDSGATLGGHGSVTGTVNVASGATLSPGYSIGTLSVGGLNLAAGSVLDVDLGAPAAGNAFATAGISDHVAVTGTLTFNGTSTLNLADGGGMGPGLYSLFGYGTLVMNGCSFGSGTACLQYGTLPTGVNAGDLTLVNNAAGKQIDLYNTAGLTLNIWDPSGNPAQLGGSGTWTSTSMSWTDTNGNGPGPMSPNPGFAIFQGTPGTVTLDNGAGNVSATGMQFAVDGYTLTGGKLALVDDANGNAPVIRVGDGSAAGAGITATIDNQLTGVDGLVKADYGTLVLAGANNFTGGMTVTGGTLEIAPGGIPGRDGVTVDDAANAGATLQVDAGVTLSNAIVLNHGATLDNAGMINNTVDPYVVQSNVGAAVVDNHDGGFIGGSNSGIGLLDGGVVTNQGSGSKIAALARTGAGVVIAGNAGTVNNLNGAVIMAPLAGVAMFNGGTLTNAGAGSLIASTSSNGVGFGNGVSVGVQIGGGAGTVINQGGASISGAGDGIVLFNGGSVTNGVGSTIRSMGGATGDCNGLGNCSIFVYTGAPLGGIPGSGQGGALTLVNAGSIYGNVQMDPNAANATTLDAGGLLDGDLGMGSNAASTLTLAGSAGTSQLYSQAVTGATTFAGTLTKSGDGAWIIDSDDLATLAATSISAGSLQVGDGGATGSIGNADISNAGALIFDRAGGVTYSGVISGSGTLAQAGSGTLTLTGDNTFSGGTTISAGTLQVGAGGTSGSIAGDVVDNAALVFDRGDAVTLAGAISGTGTLTQQGTGALTLDGDSRAFAGSTTVQAGTLIVGSVAGNGAQLGGDVTVDAGATLGGHGSIGGNVDVASGAHVAPGNSIGTLSIDGNATFAAGSVLDAELGAPGANLQTAGAGDSIKVGGALSLAGTTLNVTDAGGMGPGLYNLFTYGSLTTNGCAQDAAGGAGGCVIFGATPTGAMLTLQYLASASQINLFDSTGMTLNVWNADGAASATQMGGGSGIWSATSPEWTDATGTAPNSAMQPQPGFAVFGGTPGTVTVDASAGTVSATGMQFAVDGYTLAGDALTLVGSNGAAPVIRVGDGSASGAAMTATMGNVLAGTQGLNKTDLGTLVLTNANTVTGGTTISAGTLRIGNGGTTGSITGNIANNGALVFDRSDDVTFAGAISGTGALVQQGQGTLILNAANSLTGATTVQSGTLIVGDDGHANASLAGAVNVAAGATLGGFGTVGSADVSGTLSPGHSIGTLHVTGDATFEQGSTFEVEAAADGSADLLAVGGKATIKGGNTLVLTQAGNWAPRTTYTILTAGGGVSGTFAGVSDNLAFLDPTLAYAADAVSLTLERNDVDFQSLALTPNERNTATAENGLGWGNTLYDALVKLDATSAPIAFDQTSGEFNASQQSARVDDSRYVREAMNQRLRAGDADAEAGKLQGTRVTAWAHGWGHWGTLDGDGNAAKLSDNGDGLLIGADLPVSDAVRVGVTGGATRNSLSVRDRNAWGKQTAQWLGVYGGFEQGSFALRAGLAHAWEQVPGNRVAAFPGFSDRLSSNASGNTTTAYVEGAWKFSFASGAVSPYLNLANVRVHTDGATEVGGAAALRMASAGMDTNLSTLGARGQWRIANHLSLHADLGWQHAFGDITPERTQWFASGSDAFTVYGVPLAKNAGVARLGIDWRAAGNITVTAGYEGLHGGGVEDNAAKASINIAF